MSEEQPIEDVTIRAQSRPDGHAARPAAYASRPAAQPSRKLFQDIAQVKQFNFPDQFMKPAQSADASSIAQAPTEDVISTIVQVKVAPARQKLSAIPHKPEPSLVLRRESFIAQAQASQSDEAWDATSVKSIPEPRSFAPPAKQQSGILHFLRRVPLNTVLHTRRLIRTMPLPQRALTAMAVLILVIGSGISISGFRANDVAKLKAAEASIATAASATTISSDSAAVSTALVTAETLRSYHVAPDAARYISISKLGVLARVLEAGLTKDGALATTSNVFDTAWYKDSAKPGQPGASLIDGSVVSNSTDGVFHDVKNLVAGDIIQVERGDGKKLNYAVVKIVTSPAGPIDLNMLVKPVIAGKSGLNLISSGGKYDPKHSELSQHVAVFATLNN